MFNEETMLIRSDIMLSDAVSRNVAYLFPNEQSSRRPKRMHLMRPETCRADNLTATNAYYHCNKRKRCPFLFFSALI